MDTCSRLVEPGGVEWNVNVDHLPKSTSGRPSSWYCQAGAPLGSVAKELGLRDSVLRRWVDKLRQQPASAAWRPTTQATPMPADQASEIARLRQENERLRMERDILKNCPGPWHACAG